MLDVETLLWKSGYSFIAGIDEAGRGPLAGPVVAAAVIFPKQQPLLSGIRDSKQLNHKNRKRLFSLIREHAIAMATGVVSQKTIDELNILQATLLAMQRAVENLPCRPDYLLIDGNKAPESRIKGETLVSGDRFSMTIAAASIVAKVSRDEMMIKYDKMYPHYGFARHKGYPTRYHRNCIDKFGVCPLHRKTFKVRKAGE